MTNLLFYRGFKGYFTVKMTKNKFIQQDFIGSQRPK